jgi:prevent-host-death family protein
MSLIGVRELRQQASEVIRCVREEGAEFVVTYQGKPVAIILPLDTARAEQAMVQAVKNAVLAAQEVQKSRPQTRHGIPLLPTQPDAGEVTLELVNQLRDEAL